MVRSVLALAVSMAFLILPACTSTPIFMDASPCLKIDDTSLRLRGEINSDMQACALEALTPEITRIVVDTPGGNTRAGRAIARRIAEAPRTLVVDGQCSSSCGNYFVPAAIRIEATPSSYIALHGTPDPALMEESRRAMSEEFAAAVLAGEMSEEERQIALQKQIERHERELADEAAFAEAFRVPPGWRLYREEAGENLGQTFVRHLDGAPRPSQVTGRALLIVEPAMLEACFPQMDSENYRTNFEASVTGDIQRKAALERRGGVFSGTLTCKQSEGVPAS